MGHRKHNSKGHTADRQPETPTLGTLFDWYEREQFQHRSRQAQQAFRATFRQALLHFGPQATPTANELRDWLHERIERERLAPATANLLRAQLHLVYARARDERWPLLPNAAAFPRFPVPPRGPGSHEHAQAGARVLSADKPQSTTLPAADGLRRHGGGLAGAFLSLLRSAGLRLNEALGVTLRRAGGGADGDGADRRVPRGNKAPRTHARAATAKAFRKVAATELRRYRGLSSTQAYAAWILRGRGDWP